MVSSNNFEVLHTLEHTDLTLPSGLCKFAVSPDGRFVAIGSSYQSLLFIFNVEEGKFVDAFEGHSSTILGVDWAIGSGSTLGTIDKLGQLFVWS